MIDASRSPRSLWRRILTLVVVAGLIGFFVWAIWVKELHHQVVKIHVLLPAPSSRSHIQF